MAHRDTVSIHVTGRLLRLGVIADRLAGLVTQIHTLQQRQAWLTYERAHGLAWRNSGFRQLDRQEQQRSFFLRHTAR